MQGHRLRLAIVLAAALLMGTVGAGTVLAVARIHDTAESSAREAVERTVRIVETTVNRHLLAVDGMLAGLPALIAALPRAADGTEGPDRAAVTRMLHDLNFQNFTFRDLLLITEDGRVWTSALPGSRQRRALIGRPDWPATGGEASLGAAALLGPVQNPGSGEWTLFVVRRIVIPGLGPIFAAAEVPVAMLTNLLLPLGEERRLRIAIERGNGQLLTSLPHDETRIGRTLQPTAVELQPDGRARESTGRFTGREVILAARPTLYRDIYVAASVDAETAFAAWQRERTRLVLGMLGIGVVLTGLALGLNLLLRQRDRSEAERAAARQVLENALESLSDGFVMFDAEDRLVVCNQRYRDLYAVSAPFIVPGALFEDIIREGARRGQYPQAGEDIEAFVAETKAWHRGDHPPMERLLPDGRWILVTERRTPDGGTVGIRTDITQLKLANAELAAARDTAAAATEAKSRFLARMSHEIRTPLNGVLGLAQALAADPSLTEEARTRARTLEMAGRHLLAVSNDVLDLARIESGRLEIDPQPTALPPLIEDCLTMIRAAAEERRILLGLRLSEDLPPSVMVDGTRLRQLLLNLLSNAVKFSPEGTRVELRARRAGLADTEGRIPVRIEVRDSGPGIPEAKRAAVFGDFVQLERTGTSEGAGLGLSIAAHIVERMGGRIGCADNQEASGPRAGRGAVFWVELPLPPAAAPATPAPPQGMLRPLARGPGAGRLRILAADDVPANLAVARALLESAGHSVSCVTDGQQAVEAVARALKAAGDDALPFDVVLMDVMMPGMDGLEASRRIRALGGAAASLPIIAVTASAFPEDIAACRDSGMDEHVVKPIDRAILLSKIEQLRVARGQGPIPVAMAGEPPAVAEMAARYEGRPLLALAQAGRVQLLVPGLDAETSQRLVPEFRREIQEALEEIRTGAPRPGRVLADAAHRLAGSAATLGAERLAEAARAFETLARRAAAAGTPDPSFAPLRETVLTIAMQTLEVVDASIALHAAEAANGTGSAPAAA